MDNRKIEKGFRYPCKRSHNKFFTIIAKSDQRSERPFLGVDDDGQHFEWFDSSGCDEFMECGGSWNALNLSTPLKPLWFMGVC